MAPSAYELLASAPDDQVELMRLVERYAAAGEWEDAAHSMRGVVRRASGDWAAQAALFLRVCENRAAARIGSYADDT